MSSGCSPVTVRYRKLAKKMHPDKNGGTEEAKKRPAFCSGTQCLAASLSSCDGEECLLLANPAAGRFQGMKERYEALKKRLAGDCLPLRP